VWDDGRCQNVTCINIVSTFLNNRPKQRRNLRIMDESEQDALGQSGSSPMEEVQWTDDIIRWEGGLRVKTASARDERLDGGDSDDEEDYVVDPFK
jgi:hypothetical protein